MKLYIPTCTLNFNNIFSSESISPIEFYSQRGFGNTRFYPVCANNEKRAILLYSKYPHFKVDDSDLENYPLVLEINSDDYKQGYFEKVSKHDDGVEVYACYKTINLNPFHCVIYFNGLSERQGVLVKAEQSLENKFYKLYLASYKIKLEQEGTLNSGDLFSQTEKDEFTWNQSYANVELKNTSIDTSIDITIDRIKGFLYCYLIGANTSVSSDIGKLKALYRKLRNTLSSVVNSPDHRPTQIQYEAVLKGIEDFNHIYSSIDEDSFYNSEIIKSRLADNPLNLSCEDAERLLKNWGVFDSFCKKLQLRKVYNAEDLYNCLELISFESYKRITDSMADAVQKLEVKYIARSEKNSINSLVQISDNLSVHIIDKSYNHCFYEKFIQSQIKGEYRNVINEKDIEEPLAEAYTGGILLKDILGDKWAGSSEARYIQALLNHFQEGSPFNLFAIDNDVLIAFAAFCQKGDNIERLSEYLIQCGISNYRLAFGIYGATRGFATLPKTFTSVLIDGNREYFQIVYKTIWKMLYGTDLQNAVLPQPKGNLFLLNETPLGKNIMAKIREIAPRPLEQEEIVTAVSTAVELEDAVQSPKAFMYILDSFPNIKRTKAFKSLEKINFAEDKGSYTPEQFKEKIYNIIGKNALKSQKNNIDKAIELEAKRQNPDAFLMILDNFMDPSSPAYKKIAELVKNDFLIPSKINAETRSTVGQIKPKNISNEERNLLPIDNPTSSLFVEDSNVSNYFLTRKYLPDALKKKLVKEISKFQKHYALERGFNNNSNDNESTIDHFKNWCFYKGKYPSLIEDTSENRQYFKRLVQDLLNRYADR